MKNRKSEAPKTNANILELVFLILIIVLAMASGIYYLNVASAMSEQTDFQHEAAFEIYKQHRMKLDKLSKTYLQELVADKNKSTDED